MLREIGSDFWDAPMKESTNDFVICGVNEIVSTHYYISGRSAIRAFCRLFTGKMKVLLPAFTCETVICPFEKEGWLVQYYGIDKKLQVNVNDLISKINEYKPDVVLLQNYFGFHTLINIESVLEVCEKSRIVVVEDITHSLLSDYKRINADYYVGSLRKFYAIPEGGILLSEKEHIKNTVKNELSEIVNIANAAFSAKKKYMCNESGITKDDFQKKYLEWKKYFVEYDDVYKMNKTTQKLLRYIDVDKIKTRRRNNYMFLYRHTRDVGCFECVFDDNDLECITPLFFPVYIKDAVKRVDIQRKMAENNIYCPIVWPQYMLDEVLDDCSSFIYNHILCIPCDQRYDFDDMMRIVRVLKDNDSSWTLSI